LRHIELHGVSGFPKLAKLLNGIWMPDIRSTQLGDVLAGLAPVRSLVRLGSGVRDLIWIPIEEYRKDGRLVRGIQKGAWTFAKNATTELVKLGAKLAAGTQTILESAEQAMGGTGAAARSSDRPGRRYVSPYSDSLEDYEDDEEFYHEEAEGSPSLAGSFDTGSAAGGGNGSPRQPQRKVVSLYADQPQDIRQGINLAYQSLGRNISMASQAVQDIGPDAAQRGSARGAAAAVAKAAPVAIIRPLIGTTEAVSRALLGITNQLDPEQMKDVEDVSIKCGW
jgi:autophagy-related protein 2